MYNKKSNGPNMNHCGTPHLIVDSFDVDLLMQQTVFSETDNF